MSDDSKELSRVEDILSGEDYLPKKPMSRVEELLMDGAMVPKVDDTDNGKVLKVIDGEWQPGEDVSGDNLPPVSSLDNGKVLKVVSGEWNIGDDNSESSFVYISSSYPFSGSKVALPANINSVLIANYTSSPKVPTFLVSSNNIIFEPKEVSISVGTTPSVHIRWGRMYSTFDSATREQDIYNDSISYNTQNQTTEASYFKSKAIQTIPPVDVPDNGKVMQVGNGGTWQANYLPEVDGVPAVEQADVGKVLKATAVGEYDWGDASRTNAVQVPPVIFDNNKLMKIADMTGFPELEKVFVTSEEYAQLTTAQKQDLSKIYYVSPYKFCTLKDGEITIRVNGTTYEWFFNGFTLTNGDYVIPQEYRQYTKNTPFQGSTAWSDNTSSTSLGFIEMGPSGYTERISAQTGNWSGSYILNTPIYGKVVIGNGSSQTNTYSNPYDVETPILIYYGNKQYTVFDIPDPLPAVTSVDNGKVLKVVEGAWTAGADEGGSAAVYKTLAEYEALPTADKEDPTKIYFVIDEGTKVSPTLNADDGNVEASSYFNNGSDSRGFPWHAFDGSIDTGSSSKMTSWNPWGSTGTEWISYSFDQMHAFSKVRVYSSMWSNATFSGKYYIEGSNDGTTWTNIMLQGEYINISMTGQPDNSDIDILLDSSKKFSKIRLRIVDDVVEQFGNSKLFAVQEFEIYATDVVSTPKIYYKNVLYNPQIKELPNTVVADTGKALVVNSEGEWDKSLAPSVTPIRISKANYDALTPAQKTDPSKMYLIDGSIITDETLISPDDLRADDGKIIATGYISELYPWYIFSGYKSTAAFSNNFYPAYNSDPCYAGYHFTDKAHKITKVKYRVVWTGNFGTITNSVYVEGSNDGTNWIDIGGGAVAMSIEESSYSDYEVPCDMNEYSYVRIRFANPVNVTGSNKFFAVSYLEIYATETSKVYNAICYNGAEYASLDPTHYRREISQTDYDALPSSKNSDGIIYFITDNS